MGVIKLNGRDYGGSEDAVTDVQVNGTSVVDSVSKVAEITMPTKVSDLSNDAGFITATVANLTNYYTKSETYTQAEVDALISAIVTLNLLVVQTLPVSGISQTTIYLVPKQTAGTQDVYDEYINLDGTSSGWEHIGSTEIDLSNYYTKSEVNTLLAGKINGVEVNDVSVVDANNTAKIKSYKEVTLAEYNALPASKLTDGIAYFVKDSSGGGNAHELNDLDDVAITSQSRFQAIVYDQITQKWVNGYPKGTTTSNGLTNFVFSDNLLYQEDAEYLVALHQKSNGDWEFEPVEKVTAPDVPFDKTGTSLSSNDVEGAIKELNSATKVSDALKESYIFPKSASEVSDGNDEYTVRTNGIAFLRYQFNNQQYSQFTLRINNVIVGMFNCGNTPTYLQSMISFPVRKDDKIKVDFYSSFAMQDISLRII